MTPWAAPAPQSDVCNRVSQCGRLAKRLRIRACFRQSVPGTKV